MCNPRTLLSLLLFALLVGGAVRAAAEEGTPADQNQQDQQRQQSLEIFQEHVAKILKTRCYDCHSHGAETAEGGLVLDSRAGWEKGGNSGPAIQPGKPEASLLYQAIQHLDDSLKMPPEEKISDAEIASVRQWIELGAADPREGEAAASPTKATDHWSFQPLAVVTPPRSNNSDWPRSRIDQFMLQGLNEAGLTPAADASREVWLRRVTFDLTGLPPTPEQLDAYLTDEQPEAAARVVDRLLASSAFGERWARHWMDVVRYADSNGGGVNVIHDDAWRYRNWIIDSLNRDQSYQEFVIEQIAGDLLPANSDQERANHIVATTFLMLGPKPLAKYDKTALKLDIADEQIDTLGKAFLGLSLGCARCHDHKFDPVSMRDYYALAGIFTSTRSLQPKTSGGPISMPATSAIPLKEEQMPWHGYMGNRPPSALGVVDDKPRDEAIRRRGDSGSLGPKVPRGVVASLVTAEQPIEIPANQSGRLQLAQWVAADENPLTARVFVNRAWQVLFGEGLVSTENDFGTRGRSPSHPELLDYLATEFIQSGWSRKQLIRTIVLSRTYQLSSRPADAELTARIDPDNRLLSHASVRRLDAEAIRDAMLSISGELDGTVAGPVVPWTGRLVEGRDNNKKVKVTVSIHRRAVYLPIIRDGMNMVGSMEMFAAFDFADPSLVVGDRQPTTVPAQALYLLNSPFVTDLAAATAKRLLAEQTNDAARLERLYLLAFNRAAEPAELKEATDYLAAISEGVDTTDSASQQQIWANLCQSFFASNEFLFVK